LLVGSVFARTKFSRISVPRSGVPPFFSSPPPPPGIEAYALKLHSSVLGDPNPFNYGKINPGIVGTSPGKLSPDNFGWTGPPDTPP